VSCDNNLNLGNDDADFGISDLGQISGKFEKNSFLSKDESVALYVSRNGSILSPETVKEQAILQWDKVVGSASLKRKSESFDVKTQVAFLMNHVATGVNTEFSLYGSESSITDAYNYFYGINYYSNSICAYDIDVIRNSLSNSRPLQARGTINSNGVSGHEWVIDGYRKIRHILIEHYYVYQSSIEYGSQVLYIG